MEKDENKKKKPAKVEHDISNRDQLAEELLNIVNKASTDNGKVAFFLDQEDDPSQVTDWISTGNSELDLAIGNRPNSGFPVGRICEISGENAAGKSLVVAHVLAETQRKGGLAILFDTETALSKEYLRAIGVDTAKLMVISLDTVEDIFDTMEAMILKIRLANKNKLVTIVIDSIAAMTTKTEQDESFAKEGYGTAKAYLLSKALRKITNLIGKQRILFVCTNQLREKIGFVGLGDKFTTPGGKALPFHASVRVRLKSAGQITDKDGNVIGMKTEAKVVKNRMGPPFRKAEFNIFFASGIDNYGNWLDRLQEYGVFKTAKIEKTDETGKKKSKAQIELEKAALKKEKNFNFDFTDETLDTADGDVVNVKEVVQFERKNFLTLLSERPEVKDFLYMKLCKKFIFKYDNPDNKNSGEIEIIEGTDE